MLLQLLLKYDLFGSDRLITFTFEGFSNSSQQKSPIAEIVGIYFLGTIVPRKYRPIIFAFGHFCCEKFEETPNEKVNNSSKLSKSYFSKFNTQHLLNGTFSREIMQPFFIYRKFSNTVHLKRVATRIESSLETTAKNL